MKRCKCGKPKPYRRAYACVTCWRELSQSVKDSLFKLRDTLRLPESIDSRKEHAS